MDSRMKYHDENTGIKVSIVNYTDLPQIEVFARHTDGLLERIEKGMCAVNTVAHPDNICMMFNDPSIRKAAEIQEDYDQRRWDEKQIKIPNNEDGRSTTLIAKGVPLDIVLQIMQKEYGGFQNFSSSHFYWGKNPMALGAEKESDAKTYFTNSYFDEMRDIYEECEIIDEIRKRGLEHFKQISSTQPESTNPLFLDIAKAIVPIMAPNDEDYIILFDEPVSAELLFFTPSKFNTMSKEEILGHYQSLIFRRERYMQTEGYANGAKLMHAFIQSMTGLGDKAIEDHTTGSSQSLEVEVPKSPVDFRHERFQR